MALISWGEQWERTVGEIGNGFVLHLAVQAEGGAQEDAGVGLAVALGSTFIEIPSGYIIHKKK